MPATDSFQRVCDEFEVLIDQLRMIIENPTVASKDERLVALAHAQSIGVFFVSLGEIMESADKQKIESALREAEDLAKDAQGVISKHPIVQARLHKK